MGHLRGTRQGISVACQGVHITAYPSYRRRLRDFTPLR